MRKLIDGLKQDMVVEGFDMDQDRESEIQSKLSDARQALEEARRMIPRQ